MGREGVGDAAGDGAGLRTERACRRGEAELGADRAAPMKPVRFGTDGIRGPAGEWPLTPEGAFAIGGAIAHWSGGPVVVGWDTRESSPALAAAVLDGIAATGGV